MFKRLMQFAILKRLWDAWQARRGGRAGYRH